MRDNSGAGGCAGAWASVGWVCSRVLPLIDRELAELPDRKRHATNGCAGSGKRATNTMDLAGLQTRRSSRVPRRVAGRAPPCRMQFEIEFARVGSAGSEQGGRYLAAAAGERSRRPPLPL